LPLALKVLLTFDCEDFINDRSISVLDNILQLLRSYNLRGLFFLTGHIAEKLSSFPRLIDLVEKQEVGYHSSSHSVRPIIFEYADVKKFADAIQISLERETRHINPLTGELEEKAGLVFLRSLFPTKKIVSFRAPGFSYSPPHLEAMRRLGITHDFSASLSLRPIYFKGITFYPASVLVNAARRLTYASVFKRFTTSHFAVLTFHPSYFVNAEDWDKIYYRGNPKSLQSVKPRSPQDTRSLLKRFEMLLRRLSFLERGGLSDNEPRLERGREQVSFTKETVFKSYEKSARWATRNFGCTPRFILDHYLEFFYPR